MTLAAFQKRSGSEEVCRAHLEAVRWLHGPICPACGVGRRAGRLRRNQSFLQCRDCGHQFSVRELVRHRGPRHRTGHVWDGGGNREGVRRHSPVRLSASQSQAPEPGCPRSRGMRAHDAVESAPTITWNMQGWVVARPLGGIRALREGREGETSCRPRECGCDVYERCCG